MIAIVFFVASLGFATVKLDLPSQLIPKDNPMTEKKVELGKKLYFDPRLSFDGSSSCNSCHNVMAGGDDGRSFSVGINGQKGGRNSPSVWNAAWMSVLFWDGRAASLEEQAFGPLLNPVEMGNPTADHVVNTIKNIRGYVTEFSQVFGNKNPITKENIGKAIAAFERTLINRDSAFDAFRRGNKKAMTLEAQKGWKIVQDVGCTSCHSGPNFAGPELPLGTGFYQKFPLHVGSEYDDKYSLLKDQGRFEVTKLDADKNMWRVPTWRNVALTAPYLHNGSVKTLDEVVLLMGKTQLNKQLTETEVKSIVAFLQSLTGKFPEIKMPRLPVGEGV